MKTEEFNDRLLDKWVPTGFAVGFGIIGLASLAGFIITGMWHCIAIAAMSAIMVWVLTKSIKENA